MKSISSKLDYDIKLDIPTKKKPQEVNKKRLCCKAMR